MEKVALVTGSSRGIGRAIALRLAREGYALCVNCVERMDLARALAEGINSQGGSAMAYQADVSDASQVADMLLEIKRALGPVSVLVNNAGIAGQMLFQDITPEQWRRYLGVNLDGAFNCCQAVLPDMLHEKSGCIVNISSIWGLRGASCEVAYSCTKAALIGLTRSLAMELAPSGIRVNCVCPGVIDTDMLSALPDGTLPELARQTPMGRLGTPDDVAGAVAYFASGDAAFVTGQVLCADGGFIV